MYAGPKIPLQVKVHHRYKRKKENQYTKYRLQVFECIFPALTHSQMPSKAGSVRAAERIP